GVDVELLAQAVHGNEIEAEIEFGEVEDLHGERTAGRMRGAEVVGLLPDSLLGNEGRFEMARIYHGWRARWMISSNFSKSSREGFCPERVRKKTGSCATSFSSLSK